MRPYNRQDSREVMRWDLEDLEDDWVYVNYSYTFEILDMAVAPQYLINELIVLRYQRNLIDDKAYHRLWEMLHSPDWSNIKMAEAILEVYRIEI